MAARVKALAIYGNSVFIGGAFRAIDGATRNRLGAVRLIQGDLLPWNPNANSDVYAVDASDNGTRVSALGGPFSTINGKDHYSLAMLNNTTGAAFDFPAAAAIPKPTATCTTRVKDIDTLGDNVYVSNGGDGGGCYDGVLAAQVSTGKPPWKNTCLGATEAIKAIGNWLYKGSHAHNCSSSPNGFPDGTGTHYLLVESTINGNLGPWFPNTDANPKSTTQVGPLAMAGTDTDLWVGGDFLHVNGTLQGGNYLVHERAGGRRPRRTESPDTDPRRHGWSRVRELRGLVRPGQPVADLQREQYAEPRQHTTHTHTRIARRDRDPLLRRRRHAPPPPQRRQRDEGRRRGGVLGRLRLGRRRSSPTCRTGRTAWPA